MAAKDGMPGSYKQVAYEHIRRKLLSGELPPGARLSNRALAEEIGISFIPVREAISQLASEGLVKHRPGIGSFVVMPSRQEIQDLYDLREALECHAVVRAVQQISPAQIDAIEEQNQVFQQIAAETNDGRTGWNGKLADRCLRADTNLHVTLMRAAGNVRLVQLAKETRIMVRLFVGNATSLRPIEDLRQTYDEHAALIAALRQANGEVARRLLAEHIRATCRDALNAFDERRLDESGEVQTAEQAG